MDPPGMDVDLEEDVEDEIHSDPGEEVPEAAPPQRFGHHAVVGRVGAQGIPGSTWGIAFVGLVLGSVFLSLEHTFLPGYESVQLMGYSGAVLCLLALLHAAHLSSRESSLHSQWMQQRRGRRTTMRIDCRQELEKVQRRKSRIPH